jgi:hypothetical protein
MYVVWLMCVISPLYCAELLLQSIVKPNPLGTVQDGNRQRFYFDTRGGIYLPSKH